MRLTHIFLLVASFALFSHVASTADFGIGFNFALGYGTASIYYSNGTTVNIAKIEGGPDYKAMMRAQQWHFNIALRVLEAHRIENRNVHTQSILSNKLDSILHKVPPWLGGPADPPDTKALLRMLLALKTTTDSYTETTTSMAEMMLSGYAPESFMDSARAAADRLKLKMPRTINIPAALFAMYANKIEGDESEQLVLAIDDSRAALTLVVLAEEDGIAQVVRGTIDNTLGFSNRSLAASDALKARLSDFFRDPRGDGSEERIRELVLLGELTETEYLRGNFMEALEGIEKYGASRETFSEVIEHTSAVDPVFAASSYLAEHCWRNAYILECAGKPWCNSI